MARMRFTLGTRYLLQGQVYLVRQVLVDRRLVVENQSFGGQAIVTQDDLCASWARGELRFEVQGPNTRRSSDSPIATAYTFADFQHLPPRQRDEAWRRYQLIHPLLLLYEGDDDINLFLLRACRVSPFKRCRHRSLLSHNTEDHSCFCV